ncbi:MAG TPA: lytic transglycosylase domain-containing protein [Pyrinomonadaceae bacterium]|nr:lytic transglycosylase domain-containing protein [Pyrinomonadaceae bacterium]
MNRIPIIARILLLSVSVLLCSAQAFSQTSQKSDEKNETVRLKLSDGSYLTVDDAWETPQGVWYKQRGISHLLSKDRVKKIERTSPTEQEEADDNEPIIASNPTPTPPSQNGVYDKPAWIYLKGGARFEADSATESPAGVWYKRGPLAIFIERSRIEKVEPVESEVASSGTKGRAWTTGRQGLDSLISQNGHKYGVDPYLIFLVMEQESHFNPRALSPKGARGLMQLMPGTAARFGVRRPHDPAQNISGGTRYLRELLNRFNNRVDLVLASYNAGEGAVIKFGHRVPPYRETRNYVKKISYRYKSKMARTKKGGATTPASAPSATGGR